MKITQPDDHPEDLYNFSCSVRLLAAGRGRPKSHPATNSPSTGLIPGVTSNAPNLLPSSLNGYVPDDKYKLRAGDRVAFQIMEDRDAPKSLVVADSGELEVPYVGRVAATDKTGKQLADVLKTRPEQEYSYS